MTTFGIYLSVDYFKNSEFVLNVQNVESCTSLGALFHRGPTASALGTELRKCQSID